MQVYGLAKREVVDLLRDKGIQPTTHRVEIAHLLLQKAQHLSAEEVYQKVNSDYEQVSQATVYNALRLFVERGVVRELVVSNDRIYYDSNTDVHHHFIDNTTGAIFDIPTGCVQCPELSYIDQLGAEVHEVSLVLRGKISAPK